MGAHVTGGRFASLAQIMLTCGGTIALSGIIARSVRRNDAGVATTSITASVHKVDLGA